MRQVPYNNSAALLRFEYGQGWDLDNLTGVNLPIKDLAGSTLLASTAATLFTATTLASAAAVGDAYVELDSGHVDNPSPGDRYYIAASSAGPSEVITCRYFDATNHYIYTEHDLREAHSSGAAVKGLYCTYELDTSTTTTWIKNKQMQLIWTPTGSDDLPAHERGEIAAFEFVPQDFETSFQALYPREYRIAEKRPGGVTGLYKEAMRQLEIQLKGRGLWLQRSKDQDSAIPAMLATARLLVVNSGGDKWANERDTAQKTFNELFNQLCSKPLWIDADQDDARDDEEIDDYSGAQLMGSERAI